MATLAMNEAAQLKVIEDHLIRRFGDHIPTTRIRDEVARTATRFDRAKIRTYVPVLVQHEVTDILRHAG